MTVQPRASELVVRLHVPAAALADADLPRLQDGRLDAAAADASLRIVAADIARNLDVRQDDAPLAMPVAAARIGADQHSLDVELTYGIRPPAAGISARVNAFRAERQPVRTDVRYVPPAGPAQTMTLSGAPARVLFDPGPAAAVREIVSRGLRALFDGGDQLLLLVCLLVPLRRAGAAAALVAAMALGQTATMVLCAAGFGVTGDWLIAMAMVAASIVVLASLQNIVRARFRWIVPAALAFGLLNGFTFGAIFAGAAPYTGAHHLLAFAAFLSVVELGQLWLGATLWASRSWLDTRGASERLVVVLASAIVAHDALHRVVDRGHLLAQSGSFGGERALVWLTVGWIGVMIAVGIANAWSARARRADEGSLLGQAAKA